MKRVTYNLREDQHTFLNIFPSVIFDWEIFQLYTQSNIKTQNLFKKFFRTQCLNEIMCNNIVQPERPQVTVWHKRVACWSQKCKHKFKISKI